MDPLQTIEEKANSLGMIYASDLLSYPFVKQHIKKLPYSFVQHHLLLPLEESETEVTVALCSPYQFEAIEEARLILGKEIKEVLSSEMMVKAAIEVCYHQDSAETTKYIENAQSEERSSEDHHLDQEYDLLGDNSDSVVIRMLNMILLESLKLKSSDIHFEPTEGGMNVRYRIDGVLQTRHKTPKEITHQLIARVKVLAKLDISEYRLPQDGRIKLRLGGREIDFRVSTIPIAYGERIVLRILDNQNIVIGLKQMGMQDSVLEDFKHHIHQNQGIVLVTGPTGSGKTTTLYSALSDIQSDEVNIMTIEDPVEYKIPKMAQMGVNPKIELTFARGLRHILRQDPDVIMIGEIRDAETAEIAIQASLTGHLVLSTLHTNDAPSALTRLVDMGIEPYLLSSTVLAILSQRLVRQICPHCREEYTPPEAHLKEMELKLSDGPFYIGKGCEKCFFLGYSGRLGIYELMNMDKEIKTKLLENPDAHQLMEVARGRQMITLREDGAEKIRLGLTTISEVLRVTRKV